MGSLNKEKIVFLLSFVPLILAVYGGYSAISQVGGWKPSFKEPAPSQEAEISPGVDRLVVNFPQRKDELRDPFEAISDWRRATPDPLPLPPLEGLSRRVPLPGPLAASHAARLPRESVMPEEKTENGG